MHGATQRGAPGARPARTRRKRRPGAGPGAGAGAGRGAPGGGEGEAGHRGRGGASGEGACTRGGAGVSAAAAAATPGLVCPLGTCSPSSPLPRAPRAHRKPTRSGRRAQAQAPAPRPALRSRPHDVQRPRPRRSLPYAPPRKGCATKVPPYPSSEHRLPHPLLMKTLGRGLHSPPGTSAQEPTPPGLSLHPLGGGLQHCLAAWRICWIGGLKK